jgi:hypothetical protein
MKATVHSIEPHPYNHRGNVTLIPATGDTTFSRITFYDLEGYNLVTMGDTVQIEINSAPPSAPPTPAPAVPPIIPAEQPVVPEQASPGSVQPSPAAS